ncbi:unnamed protein product, partial [Tetraodon nigroviridis]
LTDLPTELLEHILCFPVLQHIDICNVSCCCKRLHDVCHGRGKVWGNQYKLRWPRLQRFYRPNESWDWLSEYRARHKVGTQIRRTVESISKRFFTEVVSQVLGDSFAEIESLGMPEHFCEDELLFILNSDKRKNLTLKYYAKKILYFLRQQNILRSLKSFLERPAEQQSALEGVTSEDIFDFVYIDAFGKGKQLTAKECEYLIGHQVTADYYSAISTNELLLRMVGNLLNIGKRGEGNEKSYQLLRDSLDLYLTINPDNVQYLLLQARLYFHLGIMARKVQHTLEHIQHKKHPAAPEVKLRSSPEHAEVQYSVGLIMKHKRSGYNCVIYGWDPKCTMNQEWITTMRVNLLPNGPQQPFYNVLVQDGTCRYAAQENLEPHSAPMEIGHPEVGRYFSEFANSHYAANEELQARYPEDTGVTLGTVRRLYH